MTANCGHLCSFEGLAFDRGLSNFRAKGKIESAVGEFDRCALTASFPEHLGGLKMITLDA